MFQAGVTHTQYSADPGSAPEAIRRAESILRELGPLQNQHIMGWGALNPEPKPGEFDWRSLDDRVALMRRTGATMVITLCGAPDWMKGGKPGETNWDRLEAAPLPEHFRDFATLAVEVAKRYPDVKYFQIWNEFKGFYNTAENRWDHEGYTRLYNEVYDALKVHNPALQIGGPYITMDSWKAPDALEVASDLRGPWGVIDRRSLDAVEYWLAHKRGADFLTIDGPIQTKDGFVPPIADGVRKFGDVTRWLRSRTDLPIWWAEFYVELKRDSGVSTPEAVHAALTAMRDAGADAALLWEAEESGDFPALWTSTRAADGGQATDYVSVMREFRVR